MTAQSVVTVSHRKGLPEHRNVQLEVQMDETPDGAWQMGETVSSGYWNCARQPRCRRQLLRLREGRTERDVLRNIVPQDSRAAHDIGQFGYRVWNRA